MYIWVRRYLESVSVLLMYIKASSLLRRIWLHSYWSCWWDPA